MGFFGVFKTPRNICFYRVSFFENTRKYFQNMILEERVYFIEINAPAYPRGFSNPLRVSEDLGEDPLEKTRITYIYFDFFGR